MLKVLKILAIVGVSYAILDLCLLSFISIGELINNINWAMDQEEETRGITMTEDEMTAFCKDYLRATFYRACEGWEFILG